MPRDPELQMQETPEVPQEAWRSRVCESHIQDRIPDGGANPSEGVDSPWWNEEGGNSTERIHGKGGIQTPGCVQETKPQEVTPLGIGTEPSSIGDGGYVGHVSTQAVSANFALFDHVDREGDAFCFPTPIEKTKHNLTPDCTTTSNNAHPVQVLPFEFDSDDDNGMSLHESDCFFGIDSMHEGENNSKHTLVTCQDIDDCTSTSKFLTEQDTATGKKKTDIKIGIGLEPSSYQEVGGYVGHPVADGCVAPDELTESKKG